MTENTKLCDFSNTNNNDFISTLIAPATSAESYKINAALLNLVMKEQFPAFLVKMPHPILIPSLSFAICKRRKMWIMMWLNWSFFLSRCEIEHKLGFSLCPKIVSVLGISAKMLIYPSIFCRLRLSLSVMISWILSNLIMNMLHNLGREWNWWLEIVPLMAWVFGWLYKSFTLAWISLLETSWTPPPVERSWKSR